MSKVLYMGTEVPERHDLTLFPTVNDLKNQIHQAMVDVENGTLAVTSPQVYQYTLGLKVGLHVEICQLVFHVTMTRHVH